MKNQLNLISFALAFVFSLMSLASHADRVDHRQYHQQKRINHGIRTGRLTPLEARRLNAQQIRIARKEARFRSEGRLGWAERKRLNTLQNFQNRHIRRQKHDFQYI
jgi:hypothetical protein